MTESMTASAAAYTFCNVSHGFMYVCIGVAVIIAAVAISRWRRR